jgi:hypothetical protein
MEPTRYYFSAHRRKSRAPAGADFHRELQAPAGSACLASGVTPAAFRAPPAHALDLVFNAREVEMTVNDFVRTCSLLRLRGWRRYVLAAGVLYRVHVLLSQFLRSLGFPREYLLAFLLSPPGREHLRVTQWRLRSMNG